MLTNSANASATTDTLYFDGYTETVLSGGTKTATKYYNANGVRVAVRVGTTLSYLLSDPLGSNTVALNSTGQVIALQHYSPYGTVDYSWGNMPTSYGFTGQRLDSQTGLLYYNFRYYDPVSGRFVRTDTVQNNTSGMDPFAYVGDNPETHNDPTGHCWPLCTMIIGAIVGAVVSVAVTVVSNAVQGKPTSWGEVAQSAVVGAVSGAVAGLAGPEAGPLAKMAVGALSSGAGQMASNAMSGKPLMDGVGQAAVVGGVTGGLMEGAGGLMKGAGSLLKKGGTTVLKDAESASSDAENTLASAEEDGGACSFVSTTPVATDHGKQAISTLEVGEKVWAYNPQTKKMELEPIQHIWLNHDNDLVDVTLTATIKGSNRKTSQQNEVIHTNEKHPFLTKEKGFIPVSQLKPGMHVLEANGSYGVVAKLEVVLGTMWMYNLTVAQDHTYLVGSEQWIVHNCNRAKLRTNTGAGAGEQAHHIIPCACETDPNVVAATGMGFQIDSATNGIALATDPAVAAARGQVSHSGSHGVYTAFIQSRLDYWGASGISSLGVVNNTISDGLDYMRNLARLNPGIRLF